MNISLANQLFNEGYDYETGNKHPQNFEKAIEKYLESGEQGNADAICRAGYCYQFYKGGINNAIELYIQAKDAGSANAKFLLGNCYYYGKGVKQNKEKGCDLIKEALIEGSPLAQNWFFSVIKLIQR